MISPTDANKSILRQDEEDASHLYALLEKEMTPLYYDNPTAWLSVIKNGMRDIVTQFDSQRMAKEYYDQLYNKI